MMQKGWKVGIAALLSALLAACSPVSLLNLAVPRSGYHVVRDLAYGAAPARGWICMCPMRRRRTCR